MAVLRKIRWIPILAVLSCSDQTAPDPARSVRSLEAVSPQPDTAYALDLRVLIVRAVDASGATVAGVPIEWHATVAGDVVTPDVDTTDANGLSSTTLRVGETSGLHGAIASTGSQVSQSMLVHVRPTVTALELGPENLKLISRQTAQLVVHAVSTGGTDTPVPVRFGSSDDRVATVDTLGVVRARRAGRATIRVNATVYPFLIDSVFVNVREATPAQLIITPTAATVEVEEVFRFRAMALDSSGRAIDAELISWDLESPHARIWFHETFADSTVIHINGETEGNAVVTASIGALQQTASIDVIVDKLVQVYDAPLSWCSAGITFGPSGQWYYVQRLSVSPAQSVGVVRPGRPELSTWERSVEFKECNPNLARLPRPTISIDANEALYVPTREGVLSIDGISGQVRWTAAIGEVAGNIAITSTGLLIAVALAEAVALDSHNGQVVWRSALPLVDPTGSAVIDESRSVAYVTARFALHAVDLQTGEVKWELPSADTIGGVAIARDGTLYVGASGRVFAVLPNGTTIHEQRFDGRSVSGSPVIDAAGNVYLSTNNATVRAFTRDLAPLWSYTHGGWALDGMDSPVLGRDGIVYANTGAGTIAVKDGNLLWADEPQTGGRGYYSVIAPDGDLYAASPFGVYRLRAGGVDPAAQWPMTHGTPGRTGRAPK